jgi:hypothetical protein
VFGHHQTHIFLAIGQSGKKKKQAILLYCQQQGHPLINLTSSNLVSFAWSIDVVSSFYLVGLGASSTKPYTLVLWYYK